MKRVMPEEILELIKKLPDVENHISIDYHEKKFCVTNEWLVGAFAGQSFEADSFYEAAEELIDYLYKHINHDSMVGRIVTESGFPDLEKVYNYCIENQ